MDEVIDDLISLESGFNDGGLDCMEPNIIMQNNVSMKSHQPQPACNVKYARLSSV